jgi:hypothetical protein
MLKILPPRENRHRLFWPLLLAGLTLATLVPIGIHTVILDNVGIPYPEAFPRIGWAVVPDHALLVFGVICLDATLRRDRSSASIGRFSLIFLSVAAINQALFRLPIMRNVVSTKWTIYPFIDNLPEVLRFMAITLVVVATSRLVQTTPAKILSANLIAAAIDLFVSPSLHRAFAGIIAADSKREGDQLYNVPYDWHVDLPSYLTYAEPAAAALMTPIVLKRCGVSTVAIAAVIFALQGGPFLRSRRSHHGSSERKPVHAGGYRFSDPCGCDLGCHRPES